MRHQHWPISRLLFWNGGKRYNPLSGVFYRGIVFAFEEVVAQMIAINEKGEKDHSQLLRTLDPKQRKAFVRADLWQRQLKSGKYQTMQDLCDVNKVTAKYVQLILRLNSQA